MFFLRLHVSRVFSLESSAKANNISHGEDGYKSSDPSLFLFKK